MAVSPSTGVIELSAVATGSVRSDDVLPIGDVHDATQAPQGSLRNVPLSGLFRRETTAITASDPLIDARQTWNNAAVAFHAAVIDATDTASDAASTLMDFKLSGVTKLSVTKDGLVKPATGPLGYYPAITGETGVTDYRYDYGNVKRFGVVAGVVNSANDARFNNALASAHARGGDLVYVPGDLGILWTAGAWVYGTATGGIRMEQYTDVTLAFLPGAYLKVLDTPTANHYAAVLMYRCTRCRITGLRELGNRYIKTGTVGEDGHGIAVMWCTDWQVDNCVLTSNYGDGLFTGANDGAPMNSEPWNVRGIVYNLRCDDNRRQGWSITGDDGLLFQDVYLTNTAGTAPSAGLDIEAQVGLTTYPTGTNKYAPTRDIIGTGIYCYNNVYGVSITGGAQRVRLHGLTLHNNSTNDLLMAGYGTSAPTGGVLNQDCEVTGISILHDESVAPVPLPTCISTQNGAGHRIGDFTIRGTFLKGVYVPGSGSGIGAHRIWNGKVFGTASTTHGYDITNTGNDVVLDGCASDGCVINLLVETSARVKVINRFLATNATTVNVQWDGVTQGELSAISEGAGTRGVQIIGASADNMADLYIRRSGTGGLVVGGASVQNEIHVNVEQSSQTTTHTDDNISITGNSLNNRITGWARPGTLTNTPANGVQVSAGSTGNDLTGLNSSGHFSDNIAEPTTIWLRPITYSANRGDASVTLDARTDATVQFFATALTVNRTVTLPITRVYVGLTYTIVRSGLGAFTLAVTDGTTTFATIPASTAGRVIVAWNGSAWVLIDYNPGITGNPTYTTLAVSGLSTFGGNANFAAGKTISPLSSGGAAMGGVATLSGGTIAVPTTAVTASSLVLLTHRTVSGTPGTLSVVLSVGSSFTINSSAGGDNSTVSWLIVEPH